MRIPDSTIQKILEQVRIEDVVSEYTNLVQKGDRLWGLSPFKPEKTPSFTVSPDKGLYYCFSTQKGGGVIQFLMEMEKLSFPEAVEVLARKAGLEIEASQESDQQGRDRKALEELYQRVAGSFSYLFLNSAQGRAARDYAASRGLSDATMEAYSLGYAPEDPFWLHDFLLRKGYSGAFLEGSGLFSKRNPRYCIFAGRLMFPIRDHMGRVLAFGGRVLPPREGPKYINSPETSLYRKSKVIYGLWEAKEMVREKNFMVLCEGYLDVLSLHEAGVMNAGAPLGTAFTEEQAKLLRRYTQNLHLLFDEDEAGTSATRRALEILEGKEFDLKVISLPAGKDPGDMLQKGGSQALANAVYSSSNALDYLMKKAVSVHDLSTPSGKERAVEQLFHYLSSMASAVKRESALTLISDGFGLPPKSVREDFARFLSKARRPWEAAPEQVQDPPKPRRQLMTPDLYLMLGISIHYEEFPRIRVHLSQHDLTHPWALELYIILEELYREGQTSQEAILSRIADGELRQLLMKKRQNGEFDLNPAEILNQSIIRLKMEVYQSKRTELDRQIKRLGSSAEDQAQLAELLKEKMYLDAQLEELKVTLHDRTSE